MQCSEFDRHVLKVAVGQICHSLGWNSMQQSSLNVLTDILERYIKKLTNVAAGYGQHFSRKESNLADLGLAFDQLGIQVCELDDYVHQVEPIHITKTVPQFPVSCKPLIKFPIAEEQLAREEHYDEHLPPLDKIAQDEPPKELDTAAEEFESGELLPPELPQTVLPLETIKREHEESPLYSPVDQKNFSLGTQPQTADLIRPELIVQTPEDIKNEMHMVHTKSQLDDSSTRQETIEKTAVKRPASSMESLSSNISIESKSRLSPVPNKKTKLSSPENDSYLSKVGNKQYQDGMSKDTFAGQIDNTVRPKLHIPLDKRISEYQRLPASTPEDTNSPVKDNSPVTPKQVRHLPEDKSSKESSQFTSPSNVLKEGNQIKPEKKAKKEKKIKSKKASDKKTSDKHCIKKAAPSAFLGSPQLFASPHLLKSPSEPRVPAVSTPSPLTVQRLQVKSQNETSSTLSPKASKDKTKESAFTPQGTNQSPCLNVKSAEKKTKKVKKKHVNKKGNEKHNNENQRKITSPYNATDKQTNLASPPLKQSHVSDNAASPSTSKSSLFSSMLSRSEALTPDVPAPITKITSSLELQKKEHNEKKHKKDKKSKKKEKLDSATKTKEDKKPTQSLKLTFKRSSAMPQHDSESNSALSSVQFHGVSPTISSPYETQSQNIITSTPQPKKKKSKKDKSLTVSPPKERAPVKLGVKIEPLVVNESFADFDTSEVKSSGKKTESKRGNSSKKGESSKVGASPKKGESSSKKSDSAKKAESGKKSSSKKNESSSKKSNSAKKTESLQANYSANILISPVATTPTGEQSVSRGLFIQTITEAPPTQVWYCPSCLRPDDGSPMIGCDSCDGWYHWTCVGIKEDPVGDAEWYCSSCIDKMNKKKGKKRKKKD